jgi:hypothetical protein
MCLRGLHAADGYVVYVRRANQGEKAEQTAERAKLLLKEASRSDRPGFSQRMPSGMQPGPTIPKRQQSSVYAGQP